mgnify:CR=1 FL=1
MAAPSSAIHVQVVFEFAPFIGSLIGHKTQMAGQPNLMVDGYKRVV